jgi:hypothetical protein
MTFISLLIHPENSAHCPPDGQRRFPAHFSELFFKNFSRKSSRRSHLKNRRKRQKKIPKLFQKLFGKSTAQSPLRNRKVQNLSETEVLQMQTNRKAEAAQCSQADTEDLIDTLIAISVVAKRLAVKLRKEGEQTNEQNERTVPASGRPDHLW